MKKNKRLSELNIQKARDKEI